MLWCGGVKVLGGVWESFIIVNVVVVVSYVIVGLLLLLLEIVDKICPFGETLLWGLILSIVIEIVVSVIVVDKLFLLIVIVINGWFLYWSCWEWHFYCLVRLLKFILLFWFLGFPAVFFITVIFSFNIVAIILSYYFKLFVLTYNKQ